MIDGVSAMRLLQASMSTDPDERHCIPPWADTPRIHGNQASSKALAEKLFGASRTGLSVAADAATFPAAFARTALRTDGPWSFSAPRTPLNVAVTGSRKFVGRSWPIERFSAIAAAADCRLNDVVLAACAGGLRRMLLEMSALPDASLTALVPVSLRGEQANLGGNAVGAVLCNLGTNLDDPRQRLSQIIQSMHDSKEAFASMSKRQAEFMLALMLSPVALGRLFRLVGSTPPPFNLVISNVPGPSQQQYWNGARLREIFPLSLLVDGQALNISCASHDDVLSFGAVACARALPHADRLFDHVEAGLAELERAVG
jgi:diacylglycerol O-acyltransferase